MGKGKNMKYEKAFHYVAILLGTLIYSISLICFVKPAGVPLGGATGIALVLNYLFDFPVGVTILAINIPLFFIGYKFLGKKFIISTMITTIASSVFIDVASTCMPVYQGDLYLSILYGGVGMGIGLGLIINAGSTSGGTEILSKLLNKFNGMDIGTSNMCFAVVIISISAFIYGHIESAMYAVIIQFISSRCIDAVLHGASQSSGIFIITEKPEEVSAEIMKSLERGMTSLKGVGMYSKAEKYVLLCTVHKHETHAIKMLISQADPTAFVMFTDVKEVYGNGFKQYIEN